MLALATHGFRAYTSETALRMAVLEQPRAVPSVELETMDGQVLDFGHWRGRWLLVDFIYTRCQTYCVVQGSQYAQLQDRLAPLLAAGNVGLISLSFDPDVDDPAQLAAYQQRSGDRGMGWIAARPQDAAGLAALKRSFGITVIDDGFGGYLHNAALSVVDPDGRLVRIFGWDQMDAAEHYLRAQVGP